MAAGGLAAVLARAALPVLQRLPPEPAHDWALRALKLTRSAWRPPTVSSRLAVRVFGKDFWAYGLDPNRPTWAAIGRFVHEQGLAPRVVTPEELFPVKVN